MPPGTARFLFTTCQIGAEASLKAEIARRWPDFRFSYSRPGFLTFKLPEAFRQRRAFSLDCVLARSWAFSLGRVGGDDEALRTDDAWRLWNLRTPPDRMHVFSRDAAAVGRHGFEPAITAEAVHVLRQLEQHCPPDLGGPRRPDDPHRPARRGELVMDCAIVGPGEWWIGYHRVDAEPSRWPGGVPPLAPPAEAVSRAWLKMEEALRWSRLPIGRGAQVVEIGSSPGGASQALLSRGCRVTGIDPAEMHPAVLEHPNFTFLRGRAKDFKRKLFRRFRWLTADMNVAPNYTLDAVEAIATSPEVQLRGMLLTLKLTDWKLAAEIDAWLERIRGWGFNEVQARQLAHNRQEICVAALKRPFRRK